MTPILGIVYIDNLLQMKIVNAILVKEFIKYKYLTNEKKRYLLGILIITS